MSKQEFFPGIHTVTTLLRLQPERVQSIWIEQNKRNKRLASLLKQAEQFGIAVQTVQQHKLDQLCEGAQHQGIIATCSPTQYLAERDLLVRCGDDSARPPLLLALDEISDPHNLGACLRTADAADVDAVIVPQRNTAPLSPIVHKIASGASIRVPIVKTPNLARFVDAAKKTGLWVYGADGSAKDTIYSLNLTHPSLIIMGAEGPGMRDLTKKSCDQCFHLPMQGTVESLNVSVATGICLYEALRQRTI